MYRLGAPRLSNGGHALSGAEAALVTVTSAHLCFLPWALGGMHVWSQVTSLGLSLAGLLLAQLNRSALDTATREATSLRRWPVLWCGVVCCLYLIVQALNPAWRHVADSESWWLEPVTHLTWLPSSVAAPLAESNPWRTLLVGSSLLALLASLRSGFTRRRSFRLLLVAIGANALALAAFGLVQRAIGATRIFGVYLPSNDRFIASFIYPNHAGAYFNLMVALCSGLASWDFPRAAASRRGRLRFAGIALATMLASTLVVATGSRMSALLLLVFLAGPGSVALVRAMRASHRKGASPGDGATRVTLVLAAGIGLAIAAPFFPRLYERFTPAPGSPARGELHRRLVRDAAAEMACDRWLLGWGAGSFRHAFPLYAQHHPAIYQTNPHLRQRWEHVHNDWIEYPLELGLIGTLPLLAVLLLLGLRLVRLRCWRHPFGLTATAGILLLLVHATVDFVLQSPAVLATGVVLAYCALRSMELERHVSRQTACTPARVVS